MTKYQISASILSADFARLGENINQVLAAGADMIHVDVMDNHYVPNLTFGPMICSALRDYGITVPFDVHLMIKPVDALIPAFAKAGATTITFHPEATEHVHRTMQLIRDHGCKVGLALNPATPLHYLDFIITELDLILVMSVNPGFGGQKFIPESLDKIQLIKQKILASKKDICLSVDGGVNTENIAAIAKAGANHFVMGSALFHSKDYAATINNVRKALA
jgi:ribulose-phosphate 3-epimerase